MATKTFLFVGYSLRDADFQEVWNVITTTLGRFTKLAYAIDIDVTPEVASLWKQRGIELVKTSDLLFVRALRKRLEKEDLIPSEKLLEFMRRAQRQVSSTHYRMGQQSSGKLECTRTAYCTLWMTSLLQQRPYFNSSRHKEQGEFRK